MLKRIEIPFCKNCKYILKPTGAYYTPHPLSICTFYKKNSYVTGEIESLLCKDINKDGKCDGYKEELIKAEKV
jgi:hypothetical protein